MTGASPTPGTVERQAYSVEEVAAALGISRTSAYLAAQRGELPSVIIGRRRVVPKAALERLLAGDTPRPATRVPRPDVA